MSNLVIVESPVKAKTIASMLGPGWSVQASYGHIRDLPTNDLGILADYQLIYKVTDDAKDHVQRLRIAVSRATHVYLAADPDREGEAIAWHVQQELGLSSPMRITFGEITVKAVQEAVSAPRAVDENLVRAQEARRAIDRLVGWMVSPVLSDSIGQRGLSAGRVASVALRLVVDRDREIEAFKQAKHYEVELQFEGGWTATCVLSAGITSDDAPMLTDRDLAGRLAGIRDLTVAQSKEGEKRRSPPAPFITLTMQQAASNRLRFSPSKTMGLAQKLKDAGHITYHRTDNPNIASDALPEIKALASQLGLPSVDEPRIFEAEEDAQEGHVGITPTHWDVMVAGTTADEQALYKLIRDRAVASQLVDARYAVRSARLTADLGGKQIIFNASGSVLLDPGWMKFLANDDSEEADEEPTADAKSEVNRVPALAMGSMVSAIDGRVVEKKTRKPKRYTEASMLKDLKARGIGRPSTFDAIVASITDRDYAKVKNFFLVPEPIAFKIRDALVGRFAFAEYEYTRNMEVCLDGIASGKVPYAAIVQAMHAQLDSEIRALEETIPASHRCPQCGQRLRRNTGTKDKKAYDFFGCTGYPGCKARFNVGADGAPVLPSAA